MVSHQNSRQRHYVKTTVFVNEEIGIFNHKHQKEHFKGNWNHHQKCTWNFNFACPCRTISDTLYSSCFLHWIPDSGRCSEMGTFHHSSHGNIWGIDLFMILSRCFFSFQNHPNQPTNQQKQLIDSQKTTIRNFRSLSTFRGFQKGEHYSWLSSQQPIGSASKNPTI